MKDPKPVHLMTPEESRSLGWQAESRDEDGHLMAQHAPFDGDDDILWFVKTQIECGHTVTIWPEGERTA